MRTIVIALLLGLAGLAGPAAGQEAKPLTGTYFLGGDTVVDPPPDEPKDTHFYVTLTGAAAKALYAKMRGPAARDDCTGTMSKKDESGLWCYVDDVHGGYSCIFSIDLVNGGLSYGAYAC